MNCNICLEPNNIINTCTCTHQAHEECINRWHHIEFGRILSKGRLCCPQCKKIKIHENVVNDKEWSYILCPSCKKIKQYVKESCINYTEFKYRLVCNDCSPEIHKECPNCQIPIEKDAGCSHMICVNCNTHFCWICLEIHSSSDIYNHIYLQHGNNTEHELIYQNYYDMIQNEFMDIIEIPDIYLTEDIIKLAIDIDSVCELYFQEQDREICLSAIKKKARAMKYVREPLRLNKDFCFDAIKHNSNAFKYMEKIMKIDRDICLEVVKLNGLLLKYMNDSFKIDEEICLEAVKQYGSSLEYVKKRTELICLEAVKQSGNSLEYVKYQTKEICLEAVKQNGMALKHVRKQNSDICLAAVKQNGYALCDVINQTKEICVASVKANRNVIKYVDKSFKSHVMKNLN